MMPTSSSTITIPPTGAVPKHIAVIMDGNGRWAQQRHLPRVAGHKRGVDAVRRTVAACMERDVKYLTLFAFSSENWRRPPEEVSLLMRLFYTVLERDVGRMADQGIRLRIVGDTSAFDDRLRDLIALSEHKTANNDRFHLTIAANYGGRWDILQAMRNVLHADPSLALEPQRLGEAQLTPHLCMAFAPEPELFIRTGGEQRISNFLLWQLAYTELYFTAGFWPDFGPEMLDEAIASFRARERRFGRTSEQVRQGVVDVTRQPVTSPPML